MQVSPMYVLAFVFMLTTSVLLLLWHFRAQILARIMPQDGLDIEIGRDYSIHSEHMPIDNSTAAPAYIISRLPVFRYPHKLGSGSDNSSSGDSSDQGSVSNGSTTSKAAAAPSLAAFSQTELEQQDQQDQQHETLQQQQQQQQQAGFGSWIVKIIVGKQTHMIQQLQQQQQEQEPHCDTNAPARDQQQPSTSHSSAAPDAAGTNRACGSSIPEDHSMQQQQQEYADGQEEVASNTSSLGGEESCIICFNEYVRGDLLKQLPCQHCYHAACIDRWLLRNGCCPLCKVHVWQPQQLRQRLDQVANEVAGLRPQQQQQQQQQQRRQSSSSSSESAVSAAAVTAGGMAAAPSSVA